MHIRFDSEDESDNDIIDNDNCNETNKTKPMMSKSLKKVKKFLDSIEANTELTCKQSLKKEMDSVNDNHNDEKEKGSSLKSCENEVSTSDINKTLRNNNRWEILPIDGDVSNMVSADSSTASPDQNSDSSTSRTGKIVNMKEKDGSKSKTKCLTKSAGVPEEILHEKKTLMKYWAQRFRLFSRFDEGIKMDRGKILISFSSFIALKFYLFHFVFSLTEFQVTKFCHCFIINCLSPCLLTQTNASHFFFFFFFFFF